ncbi:MAG: hypothetical protein K9M84_10975 [Spirochaetia bacterium]|nr:hypothetical protein [Spirochaetia bacterium]
MRDTHETFDAEDFKEDLHEFSNERERIKQMLGHIGGTDDIRRHRILNLSILMITITLFTLEMTTHFLPTLISLEIGLLLISLKIIMLIQSMLKQNHFEFWMLNTIEYRINDMNKRVIRMERKFDQEVTQREKDNG